MQSYAAALIIQLKLLKIVTYDAKKLYFECKSFKKLSVSTLKAKDQTLKSIPYSLAYLSIFTHNNTVCINSIIYERYSYFCPRWHHWL